MRLKGEQPTVRDRVAAYFVVVEEAVAVIVDVEVDKRKNLASL